VPPVAAYNPYFIVTRRLGALTKEPPFLLPPMISAVLKDEKRDKFRTAYLAVSAINAETDFHSTMPLW
jgi:hypothetical protein